MKVLIVSRRPESLRTTLLIAAYLSHGIEVKVLNHSEILKTPEEIEADEGARLHQAIIDDAEALTGPDPVETGYPDRGSRCAMHGCNARTTGSSKYCCFSHQRRAHR